MYTTILRFDHAWASARASPVMWRAMMLVACLFSTVHGRTAEDQRSMRRPLQTDKFGRVAAASTVSGCLRAWPQRDGHNGIEQPRPGATAQYSNGRPTWKTFAGAEASRARRAGRSWPSFVQIVRTRDCRMRLLEAVVNHFVGGETSTGGCWTRCGPLHVIPRASWCSQRGTRVSAHPS